MAEENRKPEESKTDLSDQFRNLAKSMDEVIQKKFGNDLFQSVDHFLKNISFSSDFQLDWKEHETEYVVIAKIPGIPKENIYADLSGNQLKISYKLQEDNNIRNFTKTVTLHHPIESDLINAHHENGVLTVVIPKAKKRPIVID